MFTHIYKYSAGPLSRTPNKMPRTANSNRNRGDTKSQSARYYSKTKATNKFHCDVCAKQLSTKQMYLYHIDTAKHIYNFIHY